jgi:uncharacterized damage-inducible protein DinB/pimeloyl-ACP methyl ester carboxylesterase
MQFGKPAGKDMCGRSDDPGPARNRPPTREFARPWSGGMTTAPIVLVPGFWLGAWAWDEVVSALRGGGHEVTPVTLPGLESADADRTAITMSDHVDAICKAVRAAGAPAVVAVHSGAGFVGYAASDRIPELIAAMVYVDSAPGTGASEPDFDGVEKPLPSREAFEAEENLDGLNEEQLETFRRRALPQPGGVLREGAALANDARLDIPSTVICTGFTSEQVRDAVKEGYAWLGGLAELRDVTWVDLPTSHWPMWSRPRELAGIIGDVAKAHGPRRPATSSLLSDAIAHHIWATERLIDECAALTSEQLKTPAPGMYGSIIDTFRHLVSSDCWYLSFFCDGRTSINEDAEVSLAELRSVITSNGRAWTDLLAAEIDPGADVVEHGDGWEFHVPMGIRLAQVIHHGTDHRSQICTTLTNLGLTPPEIDAWAFAEATGRARPVYL